MLQPCNIPAVVFPILPGMLEFAAQDLTIEHRHRDQLARELPRTNAAPHQRNRNVPWRGRSVIQIADFAFSVAVFRHFAVKLGVKILCKSLEDFKEIER